MYGELFNAKKLFLIKFYNKNCLEGMKLIDKNKIDLIITDPPFAINFKAKKANYNRKNSNVIEGYNEILPENYYQFSYDWISEANRILKESGSMYIFSGWNNLKDILIAIDNVGLTVINHIIWKYQFGVVTKNKFVTSHYHCLYVCKNPKKENFIHFLDMEKTKNLMMVIVFITEIKKMFGKLSVNIGLARIKHPQNYLLK